VPRTDELRLALVLNGGVSLAVWVWHRVMSAAQAASGPAPSAPAVEQADRLEGVLWPALAIGGLPIVAALLRGGSGRGVSRRGGVPLERR
jgi:hypothetical protein